MKFTIVPARTGTARRANVWFPGVLPVCAPPHPSPMANPRDAVTDLQAQQIGTATLIRLHDGGATYRTARRWWRRPGFSLDARIIDGRLRAVAVIAITVDDLAGHVVADFPRPLR